MILKGQSPFKDESKYTVITDNKEVFKFVDKITMQRGDLGDQEKLMIGCANRSLKEKKLTLQVLFPVSDRQYIPLIIDCNSKVNQEDGFDFCNRNELECCKFSFDGLMQSNEYAIGESPDDDGKWQDED